MFKLRFIGFLLIAILISSPSLAQDVGEPAPDFTFRDLNEIDVSLSDYVGKVVGLYLFGHGCPFCINAAPTLHTEVYDVYKDDPNFVLLGLDTWNGSTQQVELFKQLTGAPYPLLQMAGSYESTVGSTYDRFLVVGGDGNLYFKGTARIASQMSSIKQAVGDALTVLPTSSEEEIPGSVQLYQNYPNPFNPSTKIRFDLAQSTDVLLEVFSPLGKKIETLANGRLPAGSHALQFNSQELPSGLYVYILKAEGRVLSQVMTLLR